MKKKIKRRKLNLKKVFGLVLIIFFLCLAITYYFKLKVKNIFVEGNFLVSDNEVLTKTGIKNYPLIHKLKKKEMINKLKENKIIKKVKIKISLLGKVSISVTESKPLFFDKSTEKIVLDSTVMIDDTKKVLGIPTLTTYLPPKIYQEFVFAFAKIYQNNIALISEIEYFPLKTEETVIDDSRFLFKMNDKNEVYINIVNITKFNSYLEICSTIKDSNPKIILLDSSTDSAIIKPLNEREPNEA